MSTGVSSLTIYIPTPLRERARRVSKRLRTPTVQLIKDGLTDRLDAIEAKEREEEDRKRAEKRAELESRRAVGPNLAPQISALAPDPLGSTPRLPAADPIDAVYLHHATHILEVLNDPDPSEKRLRVAAGIAAVKMWIRDFTPLTEPPPDGEILRRLERVLIGVRTHVPAPVDAPLTTPSYSRVPVPFTPSGQAPSIGRVIDDLVGRAISPDRLKSFGDVDENK